MKNIILSLLLILANYVFAQNGMILSRADFAQGTAFTGMVNSERTGRSLNYSEVAGSPYANVNFSEAKIADKYEKIKARYNSFSDQIEFQRDGIIMILPNDPKFSRIEMESPKQTLVYLDTSDELSGYFYEIANGKVALYKKVRTKFIDTIPATNSYGTEEPATFKLLEPVFYIKNNDDFVKKPRSQKDVIAHFAAKKDELVAFFKENKIKFDKEDDLRKLVNFLNKIR